MRKQRFVSLPRNASGYQLVEVMISVLVSSILMSTIMSELTKSQRFTTSTANQVIASDLVQEIVDNTRNLSWNILTDPSILGTHTLRVNQLSTNQANDLFFPRPLIQDQASLVYSEAGKANTFKGDLEDSGLVQATLAQTDPSTVQLDVLVQWREGTATRSATAHTVISQTGIHN